MIKLKDLLSETSLRTKHGSVIRRYRNNVGKQVGGSLYVHRMYADQVIPKEVLEKALNTITKSNPEFDYNCLMWDSKRNFVRFDEAPDFDSGREPHVGDFIVVSLNGAFPPKKGHSDSIWHHKWLWVKDDYKGFDVDKSKDWSKLWLAKLDEPAKGTDLTWNSQLRRCGLTEATANADAIVFGGIWGTGRIVAYVASNKTSVGHTREMGHNRWVYYQKLKTVFWHHFPVDAETADEVKNYLENNGFEVSSNRAMNDYYKVAGFLDEGKQLVMETTREEAALNFLKNAVATGSFKGKVFLAGGAVRDLVLGKKPKDLDVVVVKQGLRGGLEFAIWLAKTMGNFKGPEYPPKFNFPSHIELDDYGAPSFSPIQNDPALVAAANQYNNYFASFSNPVLFPKFGTAKVTLTGTFDGVSLEGLDVEAVASRREVYTPGSRKPKVYPGTLKDDVYRRDFRANSLVMDLTTGQTLDLTGEGINDIKSGVLRTTSDPEIIFKEDPLRMLRAVRFMAQKGWTISPETEASIRKNASWLKTISRERVRDELNKMLVTAKPDEALRKLRDLGLLPFIAPELQTAVGMTQNVHHKHDVFDHTLEVLKNTNPELVRRLIALCHDIGKTVTRSETPTGVHFYGHEDAGVDVADKILRDLKYPVEIINAVKSGVKNHMRLKQGGDDAVRLSDKALRKFKMDLGDNLEHVLDVIHADNISHADASSMPNQIENVRKRLASLNIVAKKPTLPINGDDLIAMGVKSGPAIGKILSAVTDAWFENPNLSREQAITIARTFV